MRHYFSILFISSILMTSTLFSSDRELLWPTGAPGAKGEGPDHEPAITTYRAPSDKNTGTAVIICPGGSYGNLSMQHEGHDIARWLNSFGVTGIILEYRMSRGGYKHPVPLGDAQRAIRTIRSRADDLDIDPDRIGILGFSAGGHLAASTGVHFEEGDPVAKDPVERLGSRPDFMILCYPVIAFDEAFTHRGSQRNLLGKEPDPELLRKMSLEKQVTSETPPAFFFHTDEDTSVPPENSVVFYMAMKAAGVPAEMHIYKKGHHGIGMAQDFPGTSDWPRACQEWMRNNGWLPGR
jgi:acetyl esterase/lipase